MARSTFIEDVAKLHVKGYDASGKDDLELDEEEEFSDDEKVRITGVATGVARRAYTHAFVCCGRKPRRDCSASTNDRSRQTPNDMSRGRLLQALRRRHLVHPCRGSRGRRAYSTTPVPCRSSMEPEQPCHRSLFSGSLVLGRQ